MLVLTDWLTATQESHIRLPPSQTSPAPSTLLPTTTTTTSRTSTHPPACFSLACFFFVSPTRASPHLPPSLPTSLSPSLPSTLPPPPCRGVQASRGPLNAAALPDEGAGQQLPEQDQRRVLGNGRICEYTQGAIPSSFAPLAALRPDSQHRITGNEVVTTWPLK